jgi:hypothetical protein
MIVVFYVVYGLVQVNMKTVDKCCGTPYVYMRPAFFGGYQYTEYICSTFAYFLLLYHGPD